MKRIFLNGQEIKSLKVETLPTLIHGGEGSGASLYTIILAAKWFSQGFKILFLCGYPFAQQEFEKQVEPEHEYVKFFTREKVDDFLNELKKTDSQTIIFIKNIELFDSRVLGAIKNTNLLIISGDINKSKNKNELLLIVFSTKVYFSSLDNNVLPPLEKYHAYLVSDNMSGITSIS